MNARLPRTSPRLIAAVLALAAGCTARSGIHRLPPDGDGLSSAVLSPPASAASGRSAVVTLITGDRIHLSSGPAGEPVVAVEAAPGRESIAFVTHTLQRERGQDAVVIPADAVPLIEAGRLDRQLFDVSELVRQGLDDEQSSGLPLIVTHGDGVAVAAVPPGARVSRRLASIAGQVLVEDKQEASAFWRTLTGPAGGAALATFTAGVDRVWLDARVDLLLDQSAPQIGAPAAWAAGLTGAGVTVAVLDTGVKADHPDLIGRITEAVDFTDTRPDASDDVGHGTHVAGIIAGSGAASGGRYRGIAPDASLIVGKVCVAAGCTSSAIIAGMEWAAPRARIVSMSLGSTAATDGTDPLSTAVNNLTATYGTLFVAAAGNSGRAQNVSAPAAADAALAVASVDKTGGLSSFSSRGPRVVDYAIKPDVAAPGRDIVSARAKGTPVGDSAPVDDNYTRLSGTSMATPHVSGSAALLAQQHPEWKAEQLKAALMSSARAVEGTHLDETGVGLVDLARAIVQSVYATGNLSFAVVRWPHTGEPVSRQVTYHNEGDSAVTLALQLATTAEDGSPAPAGLLAVDPEVTVPAHGTATATVTMTPQARRKGLFRARLTATGGAVTVVQAVGVFQEAEGFHLTIQSIGRDGEAPASIFGFALDTASGEAHGINGPGGITSLLLERGQYDVDTLLSGVDGTIVAAQPMITLDQDVTVILDGRLSRPITVTAVDRPEATRFWNSVSLHSASAGGIGSTVTTLAQLPFYAIPTALASGHLFSLDYRSWLHPAGAVPAEDYVYNLVFPMIGRIPDELDLQVRDQELARVDAHYHAQGPCTGTRTSLGSSPTLAAGYVTNLDQPIPGRRLELYTAGIPWTDTLYLYPPSGPTLFNWERILGDAVYQPGQQVRRQWNSAPVGPSFGPHEPSWGAYRINNNLAIYLTPFSPGEKEHAAIAITGSTTLLQDGTPIGTSPRAAYGLFAVAPGAGTYTVEATGTRVVPWSVLGTSFSGSWTFHTEATGDTAHHPLPLLLVHLSTAVDENDYAPSGQLYPLVLQVQRQEGAPFFAVTELGLEVSFDDGTTWQAIPVHRLDDHGLALVPHPAAPGFVSLRATARDAGGNSASHTTMRAYRTR